MKSVLLIAGTVAILGCAASNNDSSAPSGSPLLAHWHSSERAYHLEPLHEDVVVSVDGVVTASATTEGVLGRWKEFAPRKRTLTLGANQLEDLKGQLEDWDSLIQMAPLPKKFCPDEYREATFTREITLIYSPFPHSRRELRHTWVEGGDDPFSVPSEESRHRLQRLEEFFRGLLWKE